MATKFKVLFARRHQKDCLRVVGIVSPKNKNKTKATPSIPRSQNRSRQVCVAKPAISAYDTVPFPGERAHAFRPISGVRLGWPPQSSM